MRSTTLAAVLSTATGAFASPATRATIQDDFAKYMVGFKNPTVQSSAGGHAVCVSGMVDITASAKNVHFNLPLPSNQTAVTELVTEVLQLNSTFQDRYVLGTQLVSGTYGIYSQLCFPSRGAINDKNVQFLIHGAGFDHVYWDPAPGYSYIDYAAQQGYMTFNYDRLGTGLSDHPDPINVVQTNLQVAIAHELVQRLRNGDFFDTKFKHVVGVGHSFGSAQLQDLTVLYPKDFDAAVFTGFAAKPNGMPIAFSAVALTIASQNQPLRFSELNNGYLTSSSIEGTEFFFYRAPGFDPSLLDLGEAGKQTIALGEFLAFGENVVAKDFTGPTFVVNGENDMPNCQGDCYYPSNMAAAVQPALYPAVKKSSSFWIAPNCGHGLNYHYVAEEAYKRIVDFIKENGF